MITLGQRLALSRELDTFLRNDIACQGIKVSDESKSHLVHLIEIWGNPFNIESNMDKIRFYVMGYAAGVQSQQ